MSKKIIIKAKKIKVVKNWLKLRSIRDIQFFLNFTNFYWQFIQGFSRIAALSISILKITKSSNKLAFGRNNSSKPASSKNNNSRPSSRKYNSNGDINRFGDDGMKHVKKSGKSKNFPSQENQKVKNWLSLKNGQKVGIFLILVLKKLD